MPIYCSASAVISFVLATVSFVTSFPAYYGIFKLIQFYLNEAPAWRPTKLLFGLNLSFMLFSIFAITLFSVLSFLFLFTECFDSISNSFNDNIQLSLSILYSLQLAFLNFVWLARVRCVFKSIFKISNNRYYLYLLSVIILLTLNVWISDHSPDGLLADRRFADRLPTVITSIMLASLVYIFLNKLKEADVECVAATVDTHMEDTLVKNAILGLLPVFITMLFSIIMMIVSIVGAFPPIQIIHMLILMDIATSSLCFLLTFQYFQSAYDHICPCLDRKCRSMYRKRYKPEFEDAKSTPKTPSSLKNGQAGTKKVKKRLVDMKLEPKSIQSTSLQKPNTIHSNTLGTLHLSNDPSVGDSFNTASSYESGLVISLPSSPDNLQYEKSVQTARTLMRHLTRAGISTRKVHRTFSKRNLDLSSQNLRMPSTKSKNLNVGNLQPLNEVAQTSNSDGRSSIRSLKAMDPKSPVASSAMTLPTDNKKAPILMSRNKSAPTLPQMDSLKKEHEEEIQTAISIDLGRMDSESSMEINFKKLALHNDASSNYLETPQSKQVRFKIKKTPPTMTVLSSDVEETDFSKHDVTESGSFTLNAESMDDVNSKKSIFASPVSIGSKSNLSSPSEMNIHNVGSSHL